MEIKIKEKKYNIKYSIRTLFIYEQITGRSSLKIESVTDEYIFMYSLILANVPDIQLSFDEFIDECDTDIHMITSLKKFLFDEMNKQKQFALKEDADDSKKKA